MDKIAILMNDKLNDALKNYDCLEDRWAGSLNDTCSSRLIKGSDWVLWFPNSIKHDLDNEELNTFQIAPEETYDSILDDATLDNVIEYVKNNAKKFGWEK